AKEGSTAPVLWLDGCPQAAPIRVRQAAKSRASSLSAGPYGAATATGKGRRALREGTRDCSPISSGSVCLLHFRSYLTRFRRVLLLAFPSKRWRAVTVFLAILSNSSVVIDER
ncbi:unnamed protein product, partial [Amoebophrya sp. A120]